jgi:hypothetical protein
MPGAARFALLLTLSLAAAPASAAENAGVCRYENLMPAFLAFERQTRDLAPDQRARRFADDFASQHPVFYGGSWFKPAAKLRKDALGLLDPAHLESLPGFAPLTQARFEAAAEATGPDFDRAQAGFLRAFPDFRCRADIAFGPSFLHFDGHAEQDKSGRRHLMFGVDAIALLWDPAVMPAYYEHELFHIYHREVQAAAFPKDDDVVWWRMWEEGLATYVSQRLNPALSPQQVLLFPADMVVRMQAPGATSRAARQMLADFDKPDSALFDSKHAVSGLPERAGYYMGYELAASLGRDHSLAWLAQLPPARVKVEARKFLEAEGS